MAKVTESSEYVSPEPIRLPRKPLFRGLSSVVADLRKLQEEQLDDDLEALREMENEGSGSNSNHEKQQLPSKKDDTTVVIHESGKQKISNENEEEEAAILAADHLSLLGGFDDEGKFDNPDGDEENAGLDRDGRPLKVYKKKGQKRTTRKANMRPVRAKRPSTTTASTEQGAVEKARDDEDVDVAFKTKQDATAIREEEDDPALHSGSEFAASGQDDDYYNNDDDDEDELAQDMRPTSCSRKTLRESASLTTTTTTDNNKKANHKPDGKIKKATRKVNELAHANFRRLKLRNNGAKGGPGYNSRFRRRR